MDYKTLLHPYRFLITASLGEKAATVKELQDKLPNIPQATMYRSIQKLTEANIIKPISEKKFKGAVQVTYGLNISMEKMHMEGESVETYLNAAYTVFFSYVHNKIAEHMTKKAIENNNIDRSKFNSMKIYIKKDRIDEFTKATGELIQKYSSDDGDGYQLTTFLVPDAKGGI